MSALVHRNLRLLLIFIIVLSLIVPLVSCSGPDYIDEPASNTQGYRIFTGNTEGLRISFEYPDTLKRQSLEKHYKGESISFSGENTYYVGVQSDINAENGGRYINAYVRLQRTLALDSVIPELKIISQGKMLLGNIEGEELSYSFYAVDKVVIRRNVGVDYQGRIYSISFVVDANKYESVKEGFEHLLDTFRFLE